MLLQLEDLRIGDLLFQDLDCGVLCDTQEQISPGWHDWECTHVGMVVQGGMGATMVVEAFAEGVHVVPLSEFLSRRLDVHGRPKVFVGRMVEEEAWRVPVASAWMMDRLGKLYDPYFNLQNDAYYSAELVADAFNMLGLLFPTVDLSFKNGRSGQVFPAWSSYFGALEMSVPEGSPGFTVGALSQSLAVKIVGRMGHLDRQRGF